MDKEWTRRGDDAGKMCSEGDPNFLFLFSFASFFVVLEYYRIESYSDYVTLHIQEFLHMLEYRSYTCKKNIEIS